VHLRNHVQQQELGQLLGINAIVLAFAAVDQPQLARMSDGDMSGQRADRFVQMSVAAGGFVAH
jgi:ABC-type dipeptide/oligopeptide/nickel transport system permease subunit